MPDPSGFSTNWNIIKIFITKRCFILWVHVYCTKGIYFLALNCLTPIKVCTLDLPSPGHGSACCVAWDVWWQCLPAAWWGEGSRWLSAVLHLWNMTQSLDWLYRTSIQGGCSLCVCALLTPCDHLFCFGTHAFSLHSNLFLQVSTLRKNLVQNSSPRTEELI